MSAINVNPVAKRKADQLGRDVGSKLRTRREDIGLTQKRVERKSGIRRTSIVIMEKGAKNLTLLTIVRLAEAIKARVRVDIIPNGMTDEEYDRSR